MPSVTVAGGNRFNPRSAVVDSEVKGRHAVATRRIQLCEGRRRSGSSICCPVPSVRVAGGNRFGARRAVFDVDVHHGHAVAAACRGKDKFRHGGA